MDQQVSNNDAQLESIRTQSIAIHVSRKSWFDHINTVERNVSWNLVGVKTIGFEAVPASMDIVEEYIPKLKCELPVIYLCHFHPCIDPPICELVDQVKTNKRSVCLVIILPIFELLMEHLRGNETGCALRGEHAASKIFTPVDFRSWLDRWCYNIVPEWKIVIQYQDYGIVMNDDFFLHLLNDLSMQVQEPAFSQRSFAKRFSASACCRRRIVSDGHCNDVWDSV